jgi:hypothetical protein
MKTLKGHGNNTPHPKKRQGTIDGGCFLSAGQAVCATKNRGVGGMISGFEPGVFPELGIV